MENKIVPMIVSYSFNGNVDGDEKFVEVDGKKFIDDGSGKAKLDAEKNPIPFVEKKIEVDAAKAALEELAKINPAVADLLKLNKEAADKLTQKEKEEKEAEEKRLKEAGAWEQVAKKQELDLADALKKIVEQDGLLGKYKGSVEKILADVTATIPKENLSLIPEDFSARQKLEYISQNAKLLGVKMSGASGDGVDKNDVHPTGTEEDKLVAELDVLLKNKNKTKLELDIMFEKSKKLQGLRAIRLKAEKK